VVSSGIMVAADVRGQGIGLKLGERSFQGKQDLLFTDGAATTAKGAWERAGGELGMLYSSDGHEHCVPYQGFSTNRNVGYASQLCPSNPLPISSIQWY